jgi:hypothetical protein
MLIQFNKKEVCVVFKVAEGCYGDWLDYEVSRNGIKEREGNPLATYTEFPPEYRAGAAPYEYIMEEIIYPWIKGWADIYLETGIMLEPHGQNVVVEIDSLERVEESSD